MIGASVLAGLAAAGLVWVSGDVMHWMQTVVAGAQARRAERRAARAAAEAEDEET